MKSKYQTLTSGCLLCIFVSIWSLASSITEYEVNSDHSFVSLRVPAKLTKVPSDITHPVFGLTL